MTPRCGGASLLAVLLTLTADPSGGQEALRQVLAPTLPPAAQGQVEARRQELAQPLAARAPRWVCTIERITVCPGASGVCDTEDGAGGRVVVDLDGPRVEIDYGDPDLADRSAAATLFPDDISLTLRLADRPLSHLDILNDGSEFVLVEVGRAPVAAFVASAFGGCRPL